jgi:hypothetical protein
MGKACDSFALPYSLSFSEILFLEAEAKLSEGIFLCSFSGSIVRNIYSHPANTLVQISAKGF